MTTDNTKNLRALLKILKDNKVEEYQDHEGNRIKLSPLAFIEKHKSGKTEPVTDKPEDDLFYSATNFKDKK